MYIFTQTGERLIAIPAFAAPMKDLLNAPTRQDPSVTPTVEIRSLRRGLFDALENLRQVHRVVAKT